MLQLTPQSRIFLALAPVDFRKGIVNQKYRWISFTRSRRSSPVKVSAWRHSLNASPSSWLSFTFSGGDFIGVAVGN